MRFYLVAMIFVIFDIEVVFLYPFAVMYRQLGLFGFVEIASFTVVVFIAFAYLVSEGALTGAREALRQPQRCARHPFPERVRPPREQARRSPRALTRVSAPVAAQHRRRHGSAPALPSPPGRRRRKWASRS